MAHSAGSPAYAYCHWAKNCHRTKNLPTNQKATSGKGTSKCCLPLHHIANSEWTVWTYTHTYTYTMYVIHIHTQLKLLQFQSILGGAVHFTAVTDSYLGLFGSSAEQQPDAETQISRSDQNAPFLLELQNTQLCGSHSVWFNPKREIWSSENKKHYHNLLLSCRIFISVQLERTTFSFVPVDTMLNITILMWSSWFRFISQRICNSSWVGKRSQIWKWSVWNHAIHHHHHNQHDHWSYSHHQHDHKQSVGGGKDIVECVLRIEHRSWTSPVIVIIIIIPRHSSPSSSSLVISCYHNR